VKERTSSRAVSNLRKRMLNYIMATLMNGRVIDYL